MATSIAFNDGASATLTNEKSVPGDRFDKWEPFDAPIGPAASALGTGTRFNFEFRVDYGASFELSKIPLSSLAVLLRLQKFLRQSGTVTVNTGDTGSHSYTCQLAPDGDCLITLSDRQMLEYTAALKLISTDGATPMLCTYH
jgi:hypothetical protein